MEFNLQLKNITGQNHPMVLPNVPSNSIPPVSFNFAQPLHPLLTIQQQLQNMSQPVPQFSHHPSSPFEALFQSSPNILPFGLPPAAVMTLPGFNPFVAPFTPNAFLHTLPFMATPPGPPAPLMSMDIPTPPQFRAHPYRGVRGLRAPNVTETTTNPTRRRRPTRFEELREKQSEQVEETLDDDMPKLSPAVGLHVENSEEDRRDNNNINSKMKKTSLKSRSPSNLQ